MACVLLAGTACHKPAKPVLDLRGRQDVSAYRLTLVRGRRDGDRLVAHAVFSDGQRTFLLDMQFAIDTSARLQSGRWQWVAAGTTLDAGTVEAKSVMFFGGQNDSPSVGGTYDLLDPKGTPAFRVTIPVSLLADRAPRLPQGTH